MSHFVAPIPEERRIDCPIHAGSVVDRLTQWCHQDALQQNASVLEALACCGELLHALPASTRPGDLAQFPAGAVASLVCAVQSQLNQSPRCSS
jgi:hypothetical protein